MNGFERYTKKTRRQVFLEEMERAVPWGELCALVEPHYPKPGNGRPPVGVERMLRLYFLQQWFNLSDPAVEEATGILPSNWNSTKDSLIRKRMIMTESGAGGTTSRPRWRIILPIGNLLVALALLIAGQYQFRHVSSAHVAPTTAGEWTPTTQPHLAPATQIAYAINFPALLFATPFKALGRTAIARWVFLCAVGLVWYFVGRILDSELLRRKRKSIAIAAISLTGLLVSVLGIWFAWRALGADYRIPPLGALLWSGALAAYCLGALRNATASQSWFVLPGNRVRFDPEWRADLRPDLHPDPDAVGHSMPVAIRAVSQPG
jgi:Transposase domain (DUF772)